MADTKGYTNLDYVVKQVLLDKDDPQMHKYKKYLQLAINGFTELNLFTIQNVKVAYLPVSDIMTFDLPDDYIDYTKVGYERGGKLVTLRWNNNLILPRTTDACGSPQNDNEPCTNDNIVPYPTYGGFYYAPHYRNGRFVGEIYGARGGEADADFRIDKERRQIVMNTNLSNGTVPVTELILEYKSSGINASGETVVPRQYIPCLKAYIHWNAVEFQDKVAISVKERRRQLYYIEYEKVRRFEFSVTLDDWLDSTWSSYRQTVKR